MLQLTEKLKAGEALSPADINLATTDLISEDVDSNGKADFLTAFAEKGESAEEIASFAREFIDLAVKPDLDSASLGKPIIDVCGTGGDKLDLFNVSTTSVFLLAAAGVAVVKHGNRGITSKSGGADALEALGIRIDLPSEQFGECVASVGAGFLFAPMYHPAFKAVVPVRKALAEKGQRTVFNLLGPLLNPVDPDYQLIGIF
ncbi:MAG: anthranilate phosphoribosyltransferase, partial [Verrucomicrobiota bacterium]